MTAIVADARRFAEMHALYRMYDERGRVLYIGITGDLGKRLGEHSVKRWYPLVEKITLEWLPTRAAAMLAEKRAILAERPRYNLAGTKPPKPAKKPAPEPPQPAPRDLVDDLRTVTAGSTERVRLRAAVVQLRQLAPEWEPYWKLTAKEACSQLRRRGIRVLNSNNYLTIEPADLRVAARKAG